MNRFLNTALAVAAGATLLAPSASAAETPDRDGIEIYVVNSHHVPVRVFAEDLDGRLHSLGRIARGDVSTVQVPESVASQAYRLKFVPAPSDVWSPVSDLTSLKTAPLDPAQIQRVTVWIESSLDLSEIDVVEVARVDAN